MIAALSDPWFEARFICDAAPDGSYRLHHEAGHPISFAEAQGIQSWCPCGYGKPEFPLDGARPHAILIPFANPPSGIIVPESFGPFNQQGTHRPRWQVGGNGIETLTLAPSIDVGKPSCWHGFITNGEVR